MLLLPGYAAPGWLEGDGARGSTTELAVPGRGLGAQVPIRIWSPADADPAEPLPLLAAHDGPEYDRLARAHPLRRRRNLVRGALPRHRVALLSPGERNERYSASARYAGAVARDILPGDPGRGRRPVAGGYGRKPRRARDAT